MVLVEAVHLDPDRTAPQRMLNRSRSAPQPPRHAEATAVLGATVVVIGEEQVLLLTGVEPTDRNFEVLPSGRGIGVVIVQPPTLTAMHLEGLAGGDAGVGIEADAVHLPLGIGGELESQHGVGGHGVRVLDHLPGIAGQGQGRTTIFDRGGTAGVLIATVALDGELVEINRSAWRWGTGGDGDGDLIAVALRRAVADQQDDVGDLHRGTRRSPMHQCRLRHPPPASPD